MEMLEGRTRNIRIEVTSRERERVSEITMGRKSVNSSHEFEEKIH